MEFGALNLDVIWVSLTFNSHIPRLGFSAFGNDFKKYF